MALQTIKSALVTIIALAALTQSALAQSDARPAQLMVNFQAADVNEDGVLNFAEFTKFINLNAEHNLGQAAKVRRLGMYPKAFEMADANNDRLVSKAEVVAQALK